MPPRQRRRSKRLSAEDADKEEAQGGDDHSPELKQSKPRIEPGPNPRGPRRSSREKGGSAEAARNALADINRGPHCPIFQLSHELLKKIWEYLDSKTKMTTTVRTLPLSHRSPSVAPVLSVSPPSPLAALQSVCQRWQRLCWETEELSLKFAKEKQPVTAGAIEAVRPTIADACQPTCTRMSACR